MDQNLNFILNDSSKDFMSKSLELQDFFSKLSTKSGLIQILQDMPVFKYLPGETEIMINNGGTYCKLKALIIRPSPYNENKQIIAFEFE